MRSSWETVFFFKCLRCRRTSSMGVGYGKSVSEKRPAGPLLSLMVATHPSVPQTVFLDVLPRCDALCPKNRISLIFIIFCDLSESTLLLPVNSPCLLLKSPNSGKRERVALRRRRPRCSSLWRMWLRLSSARGLEAVNVNAGVLNRPLGSLSGDAILMNKPSFTKLGLTSYHSSLSLFAAKGSRYTLSLHPHPCAQLHNIIRNDLL